MTLPRSQGLIKGRAGIKIQFLVSFLYPALYQIFIHSIRHNFYLNMDFQVLLCSTVKH